METKLPFCLLKLVFQGSGGCGLTSTILRYLYDRFVDEYDPTVEDSYLKDVPIKDYDVITLDILDTAGQEEFAPMRSAYHTEYGHDMFVFMYDVTSRTSFEELNSFVMSFISDRLKKNLHVWPVAPCVIVGNKIDLENYRAVTFGEGEDFVSPFDCPFIEISAKTGENVSRLFEVIVEQYLRVLSFKETCSLQPPAEGVANYQACGLLFRSVYEGQQEEFDAVMSKFGVWNSAALNLALLLGCRIGFDHANRVLLDRGAKAENIQHFAFCKLGRHVWALFPALEQASIRCDWTRVQYSDLLQRRNNIKAVLFFGAFLRFEFRMSKDIVTLILKQALPPWSPKKNA